VGVGAAGPAPRSPRSVLARRPARRAAPDRRAPLSATPVLLRAAPHALSQTSTTRDAHDRGAPGGAGLDRRGAPRPLRRRHAAARLVVGAAYVGPKDDYGWNQGHAQGVAALKQIDGVKVVEEENVPETIQVQKTMESMISLDGAGLVFATSFGYWEHMLKVAA